MSSSSETIIPSKESRKMSHNRAKAMLMNLPPEIILDILSRLPIRTIFRCKCVCRQLLELVTSAAFAELHLPRSTPGLIIQHKTDDMLKIFEFEDEVEVEHHSLHYKHLMEFDPGAFITLPDPSIRMVGSVNGLLCLVVDYYETFYICNPITCEYIALPDPGDVLDAYMVVAVCGFGVSSSNGEYKLVKVTHGSLHSPTASVPDLKCVIYTLGTGSWRSITVGISFNFPFSSNIPHAFLSSTLHWLVIDVEGFSSIACFDLETELFHSFQLVQLSIPLWGSESLAILRDCLCVCHLHSEEAIVIYMMKDYGVEESWTKEYVISWAIGSLNRRVYEGRWALKVFKDGDILFVWREKGLFYYSSKTETTADAGLFVGPQQRCLLTYPMLHTPSLLSLKGFEKENVASLGY